MQTPATDRAQGARLFFGIPVPEALRQAVAAEQERLRPLLPKARWVRPDALHVTLKFLGPTPLDRLDALRALLESAVGRVPQIHTFVSGVDAFPSARRARVLVVSLADPHGELARLNGALEAGCAALGFPRENRPYRPHVTLARLDPPRNLITLLGGASRLEVNALVLDEVTLYRSRLAAGGSRYEAVCRARLSDH